MMTSIMTRTVRRSLMRVLPFALSALALSACHSDGDVAQKTAASPEVVARGRYLAQAADCAACHTAEGGAPFAGGVKLESQFGTFYGSNITPDAKYGIGKWTSDAFYAALHDGKTPNGKLYPAMPYTSYRQMSREDSDAIYAYLMAQKPAAVPSVEASLRFPYNVRFAVRFWDMLFLNDALPDASSGQSADWTRGRYLANALGHCAECHTPRGVRPTRGREDAAGRRARTHRRAGYHAGGIGGARLDRRGLAGVFLDGRRAAGIGFRRNASGRVSEHAASESR